MEQIWAEYVIYDSMTKHNDTFYSLYITPAAKIGLKTAILVSNTSKNMYNNEKNKGHEWPGAKKQWSCPHFKWGLTNTNISMNKFIVIFNREHNNHRSRLHPTMEFAEKTPRR